MSSGTVPLRTTRKSSMRVVIVGAGGHGQVVADIVPRMTEAGAHVLSVGYLDDDPLIRGRNPLGLPVVGRVADLRLVDHDAAVVSIGEDRTREQVVGALSNDGDCF